MLTLILSKLHESERNSICLPICTTFKPSLRFQSPNIPLGSSIAEEAGGKGCIMGARAKTAAASAHSGETPTTVTKRRMSSGHSGADVLGSFTNNSLL